MHKCETMLISPSRWMILIYIGCKNSFLNGCFYELTGVDLNRSCMNVWYSLPHSSRYSLQADNKVSIVLWPTQCAFIHNQCNCHKQVNIFPSFCPALSRAQQSSAMHNWCLYCNESLSQHQRGSQSITIERRKNLNITLFPVHPKAKPAWLDCRR